MGYAMTVRDIDVRITDIEGAHQAIKEMRAPDTMEDVPNGFAWVSSSAVAASEDLEQALACWHWAGFNSPNGFEITDFEGDSSGDDDSLFRALAPFIEAGGYIEMVGEDSHMWRWVFDGRRCSGEESIITWDTAVSPAPPDQPVVNHDTPPSVFGTNEMYLPLALEASQELHTALHQVFVKFAGRIRIRELALIAHTEVGFAEACKVIEAAHKAHTAKRSIGE